VPQCMSENERNRLLCVSDETWRNARGAVG
jgi:hypothetical protein